MKCENCKYWHYLGIDQMLNIRYGICKFNPGIDYDLETYFDDRCSFFLINHNNDLKEEEDHEMREL